MLLSFGRPPFFASASLLVLVLASACSSKSNDESKSSDGGPSFGDAHSSSGETKSSSNGSKHSSASGAGSSGASSGSSNTGTGSTNTTSTTSTTTAVMAPLGQHTPGVMINVPTANGSVSRKYDITLPATCDSSHLVPLLFAFHGDGGQGSDMYSGFPIEAAAAAAGGEAIFVYPYGTNNNIDPDGAARAWDLYHDPGPPPYTYTAGQPAPAMSDESSGNEDIDFFDAMIESIEKSYCVDKKKIWITGMSSGGYLSNQFGRWRSTVVTATAPQSGGMPFGNPDSDDGTWIAPNYCVGPTNPVPALIIHGLSDGTVDPCNALEAESYWDTANGCTNSANNCGTDSNNCTGTKFQIAPVPGTTTTSPLNSDCIQTSGCGSNPVVLCQIPGMGHQIWSSAPTVIWSFFSSL